MSHDLSWLLSPVPVTQFFDRYFEKEVLHISGRARDYNVPIFSAAAFEQVIFQSPDAVRANLSCIRTSKTDSGIVTDRTFGVPSQFLSKSLLTSLSGILNSGYSLVIMHVDRNWLPMAKLLREIEIFLFNPLDTVLFCSPPKVQGAPPHFDPYDNYILQISGEKDWRIYKPKIVLPLNNQLHSVSDEQLEEMTELRMRPGDLLYIPRGVIHEASTGPEPCMHLTVYNYAYRWRDLICDLVERLAEQEPALRRSVPLAVSRKIARGVSAAEAGVADELRSLLRYCLEHFATARSLGRHARRFIDGLLPLELGDVGSGCSHSELDETRCVARRHGMICYIYDEDEKVVIGFPGGKVSGPASIRPALEFIAAGDEPFRLRDVPGDLSPRSKEVLVRRLLREGLLVLASPGSGPAQDRRAFSETADRARST